MFIAKSFCNAPTMVGGALTSAIPSAMRVCGDAGIVVSGSSTVPFIQNFFRRINLRAFQPSPARSRHPIGLASLCWPRVTHTATQQPVLVGNYSGSRFQQIMRSIRVLVPCSHRRAFLAVLSADFRFIGRGPPGSNLASLGCTTSCIPGNNSVTCSRSRLISTSTSEIGGIFGGGCIGAWGRSVWALNFSSLHSASAMLASTAFRSISSSAK